MKKLTFKDKKIQKLVPAFIAFIAAYLFDVIYLLRRGRAMIDADMASEMILAKLLNNEHSIIGLTKSWYYSSEIRFFGIQWFYRLGFLFFPNNWLAARTLGTSLMLLVLGVGVVLLFKKYTDDYSWGLYAAALCMAPAGSWYFWQTLFGGYYLIYIIISLYTLILINNISDSKTSNSKKAICVLLISFLGFCSGMNGIKQLMVFYAPLTAVLFLLVLADIHDLGDKRIKSLKTPVYLALSVLGATFSFIGYEVNVNVLMKEYSFQSFDETVILPNDFWDRFREYIWSFGFNQDVRLMSFLGIAAMLGLLIGILTVICGIWLCVNFRKLKEEEKILSAVCAGSIVFATFIYAYNPTNGVQYYQTFVPEGLFLIILAIKNFKFSFARSRAISVWIFILMLTFTSAGTVLSETTTPMHNYRVEENLNYYVDYISILGYKQGVATFWRSNNITELSNGSIEMWTIKQPDDYQITAWLQKTSHTEGFPEGKYFYILTPYENEADRFAADHPELELIFADSKYIIYGN